MTKIIARNTTIPTKKSEMFSTAVENQTNVEIHVLQGERELVTDNKSLGNFRLDGIPKAERGVPQIEVTFDIDVDGLLSVKAKELGTGVEQSVTIQGASTLDQNEVEEMIKTAEQYETIDKEKRKNIELKNNAEALCYEANKQLLLIDDKISEEKKNNIKNLMETIKSTIQSNDYSLLQSQLEQLKVLLNDITEFNPSSNMNENTNTTSEVNDN